MPPPADAPHIGRDPLAGARSPRRGLLPARRAALGLGASATPSLAFIAIGVGLGPLGLNLITPIVVLHLDPVVSIALAALGIFVGLGLGALRWPAAPRLLAAASVDTGVTIAVVSGVMYLLLARWDLPLPLDVGIFAAVLGICSSASAAARLGDEGAGPASSLADVNDVPLVILGTLAVTAVAHAPIGMSTLLTAGAGASVGAAGVLLFDRARGDAERGVFVAGAIFLLGGIGAYAGTSPLLSGCAAALVWVATPGRADRVIASDLRRLQHPLVALLLIVAGASIQWTLALVWIAAPLVLLRLLAKLLAGVAIAKMVGLPAALVALALVPPGVIGIALALNVQQVIGSSDTLLLSGVAVATAVSELLALLLPEDPEDRA